MKTETSAHERYLLVYRTLEREDRDLARIFDDLRRSNAVSKLFSMRTAGLITDEEYLKFSQELRDTVEWIQSRRFAAPSDVLGAVHMSRRKLTAREKAERKRRREEFMTIFVNGRQKRVRRPPTIDGVDPNEFILRNADPIWLHQNGMWELMDEFGTTQQIAQPIARSRAPAAMAVG